MRQRGAMGDEFPLRDEVVDFAGKPRTFVISCHSTPLGFTIRAVEEAADGDGYEFAAYSETTPYSALGRVRDKIRRGLATRHLAGSPGHYQMTHDTIRGRITTDSEHQLVLVVDGQPLDMDDVAAILNSHEGWNFELRIRDALE